MKIDLTKRQIKAVLKAIDGPSVVDPVLDEVYEILSATLKAVK